MRDRTMHAESACMTISRIWHWRGLTITGDLQMDTTSLAYGQGDLYEKMRNNKVV